MHHERSDETSLKGGKTRQNDQVLDLNVDGFTANRFFIHGSGHAIGMSSFLDRLFVFGWVRSDIYNAANRKNLIVQISPSRLSKFEPTTVTSTHFLICYSQDKLTRILLQHYLCWEEKKKNNDIFFGFFGFGPYSQLTVSNKTMGPPAPPLFVSSLLVHFSSLYQSSFIAINFHR